MSQALFHFRALISARLPRRDDDRGAALVEYALLLVLIAMVLVIAVTVIGERTSGGLDDAGSSGFVSP